MAKQWSKTIVNTTLASATAAAVLWGSMSLIDLWNTSEKLRVKNVVFSGDVPDRLRQSLPIKPNDHLLKLVPLRIEREALSKFSELERFSIRRGLDRTVSVKGKYRTPVAMTRLQGEERAVDASGVLFRPVDPSAAAALPWIETPSVDDLRLLLSFLSEWEKGAPDFYSLVKKIETDRMRELNVELSDGVVINWGPLDEADILERAEKILRFRENFRPVKTPAGLLFVASDRIVMDKNWRKAGPPGK